MKASGNLIITDILLSLGIGFVTYSYTDSMISAIIIGVVIATILVYIFYRKIIATSLSKLILIVIFTILIFIPFAGPKETESLEKRSLAEFPVFRITNAWKFFSQYAEYFEDRYSNRSAIIDFYGKFRIKLFKLSPVPDVEICHDDWLFGSGLYYYMMSSKPFTEDELNLIELNLEITTSWLKNRNIQYYYVAVPVKARIYPEKLTASLQHERKNSRLDQIYNHIANNANINFIDVRTELINGKKIRDTYMQSDTHWNEYGGFLTYKKIMEAIQNDIADIQILDIDEFTLDSVYNASADLVELMGLKSGFPFYEYKLIPNSGKRIALIDSVIPGEYINYILFSNNSDGINKYRIYFIRDSMTQYLQKFFSLSFTRAFYQWSPLMNTPLVLQENPNIVVHEMQELFTSHLLKLPVFISADSSFINRNFPNYHNVQSKVDLDEVKYF